MSKSRWLRESDLNQRPSGYEPDELPGCSIPRLSAGCGLVQRTMSALEDLAATDFPTS